MPNINVDPDTLSRLRTAVLRKHGKLHGALSAEADEALRAHTARLEASLE
jgi:hypothetical protein